MNLTIKRLDGTTYKTQDYGLKVLDFKVNAPVPNTTIENIEGRSGFVDMGTTLEGRTMTASFFMSAYDALDFPLLRNQLFQVFESREAFYLIDDREPGKRWLVKCNGGYTIEQIMGRLGQFEVSFISASPYAESVGKTLDPMTFDSTSWQIGQGLIMDLDETDYTQSTTTFSIYNAGTETIDPIEMALVITYTGASSNLQIQNTTTSDLWTYTGTTIAGDTLKLDGIRSLKNGTSVFGSTNRQLITLKPGWNDFTLTGTSGSFTISFDFRFYYK